MRKGEASKVRLEGLLGKVRRRLDRKGCEER